ncbi:hypothetical protein [Parasphingopyxis sp.]|uniref:hypothetical protein n=1 Tax=Parasphingopyxis sp. TaxID=1920299 RepID=UPI002610E822|nr:hypothetical protein [Parasphingopyxis sp.]
MEKERLARAIARIEQAAETIGSVGQIPQPDTAALERLQAELESAKAALEERDRTIAKLRADAADIGRLKDQEIQRLRDQIHAEKSAESGVSAAEHEALQRKYAHLKATAESTLADLDQVIGKAEQANG